MDIEEYFHEKADDDPVVDDSVSSETLQSGLYTGEYSFSNEDIRTIAEYIGRFDVTPSCHKGMLLYQFARGEITLDTQKGKIKFHEISCAHANNLIDIINHCGGLSAHG